MEHAANLSVAAFDEDDLVPGIGGVFEEADFCGRGFDPLAVFESDGDAAAEFVHQALFRNAAHFDAVGFHRAVRRMRHLERQLAVIGQQHQSLGMKIEAADGIDALADAAHEVDDGAAALRGPFVRRLSRRATGLR